MNRRALAYLTLAFAAACGFSWLWSAGTFNPNAILLKTLATTGGDYGVAWGGWKLRASRVDTLQNIAFHDVYVSGMPMPWNHLDLRFDFLKAEGVVVGYHDVGGQECYPLFKVSHWSRVDRLGLFLRQWLSILGLAVAIILYWRARRARDRSSTVV